MTDNTLEFGMCDIEAFGKGEEVEGPEEQAAEQDEGWQEARRTARGSSRQGSPVPLGCKNKFGALEGCNGEEQEAEGGDE